MRAPAMMRLVGVGLLAMLPITSGQPGVACTQNNACLAGRCCRDNGFCSGSDEASIAFGVAAADACECMSGVLDTSGDLCGCSDSADCTDLTCCMADGDCSTADEGTVTGGTAADDVCECNTGRYDEDTGLCGCNRDGNCRGTRCCVLADNTCSSNAMGSLGSGEVADDVCECSTELYDEDLGLCACTEDTQCETDEICCPDKDQCEIPLDSDASACGDPHMTGFLGQKFDFTGNDGSWYALISDPSSVHINMRVTAPVPSLPEITYITGLSVITTDYDGDEHSMVIEVNNPHSLDSACPADRSVCLADGALSVMVDGKEALMAPGAAFVAPGVEISAANIPGECRSFGFEQYWERKKLEALQGRRLQAEESMGDWILGDPTMTNIAECIEYVSGAMDGDTLFDHQSEHASFRIITPTATIRLSHGRLHQVAMRDPTDQFDLPDHLTWQMNMAIDLSSISRDSQGVIGETFVPTRDDNGDKIMTGMECIRGEQEDYHVEGPLAVAFTQATTNA